MRLSIHRSDGKTGHYSQDVPAREGLLLTRLDPEKLFTSGPIVIGVNNPFSILNPDEICWIEVETPRETRTTRPAAVETITLLGGRDEYETILAQQWPRWKAHRKENRGNFLEALIELSMRSGQSLYLRVAGTVADLDIARTFFGVPVITATAPPATTAYINPRCIVRARVYHSKDEVSYPTGVWLAEADEI